MHSPLTHVLVSCWAGHGRAVPVFRKARIIGVIKAALATIVSVLKVGFLTDPCAIKATVLDLKLRLVVTTAHVVAVTPGGSALVLILPIARPPPERAGSVVRVMQGSALANAFAMRVRSDLVLIDVVAGCLVCHTTLLVALVAHILQGHDHVGMLRPTTVPSLLLRAKCASSELLAVRSWLWVLHRHASVAIAHVRAQVRQKISFLSECLVAATILAHERSLSSLGAPQRSIRMETQGGEINQKHRSTS